MLLARGGGVSGTRVSIPSLPPRPPLQIIYELTLATSTGGAVVPKGAPDEPGAPAGRDGEEGGAGGGGACGGPATARSW